MNPAVLVQRVLLFQVLQHPLGNICVGLAISALLSKILELQKNWPHAIGAGPYRAATQFARRVRACYFSQNFNFLLTVIFITILYLIYLLNFVVNF